MQLTSLEIFGFKSFAERQKFVFDKGITGIVGPNGCGKSNVVDSIRWVLGEQRTKNLRSDKMENIIFNGTKKRRKSNFAEVSLTFENTKNLLPTEYSTIRITRKLYRSGESEYQINGVTCRLKDIHNLFMDTGVSADSYAIIELKMVDEILTNKDNERRKFIEEAAGISKYKIRKKQTLKRLKDTDADLERVEDLLFEIEKNLKSLEKQARRTQRYFELKEKYKIISSQYAFLTLRSIRERQQQIELLEKQRSDEILAAQTAMATREAHLQELKKQLLEDEGHLSGAQADFNQHLQQIQSVETEKSIKHERLKYLQQRELAVQNQTETEKRQIERNRSQIVQLEEQAMRIKREKDQQEEKEAGLKGELDLLKRRFAEQKQVNDSLSAQHRETEQLQQQLTREKEIKRVQIQSLESELNRAEEDKSRRNVDLDAFGEKRETLEKIVSEQQVRFDKLETAQNTQEAAILETEAEISQFKDMVYKTNRLLDARQNEYNLTKSLVENLEGFPASVKFLKKNARWIKDAPLLSDIFSVPDAYKSALENFLDPYLSYYVVRTREDAILSVHMLAEAAKGRANFFILEELESFQANTPILFTQAQHALDIAECAPEYKKLAAFLLGQLYIVPKEADIPTEIPAGACFMTQAGNMTRRQFVLNGGSLGLFEGKRLGRAKNLAKLEKELSKLQIQLTSDKVQLDKATQKLESLKEEDHKKELEAVRKELTEKQRDLSVLQSREQEYREFLARVGQRTDDLSTELESLRKEMGGIDPQLKVQLEELQQLTARLAQDQSTLQETTEVVDEKAHAYNEAHISLIHLQNQYENLSRELEQKATEIERFTGNTTELAKDLDQVKTDIDTLINDNMQDDETIVHLYNQKKERERVLHVLEEKVGMTKNSIAQVEDSMSGERKAREKLLTELQDFKDQGTEIRLELNSLRERMSVEFKVELGDLSQVALFDNADPNAIDLPELEEKLLKIRNRVQNYGEINPMAVEAFSEMKERFDFINGQKNDLLEAKHSLLKTIEEIDETARVKFLETFVQVRENFQEVFRSLFSEDDKCDIILMDEENPLESGVNIIARPKGKRPLTIKQLSGGEKTLTAVALLFALYLIKPAPFCIFDEVDAPLDDANIDKFNNIIRDFSKTSQFIIVTHNKRTMASTNIMYGVTMENTGISRVLPVDFSMLNSN